MFRRFALPAFRTLSTAVRATAAVGGRRLGMVATATAATTGLLTVGSLTLCAAPNEQTYIMLKPDAVNRKLVGDIIARFEQRGYKLVGLKMVTPTRELAEAHYAEHKGRPFFNGLVDFLTSGPVVAMVFEGEGVVATSRKMIGATNPRDSASGTIRGDYAVTVGRNIIHGSDSIESAQREIHLWFKQDELNRWQPADNKWLYE